MHGLEQKWGDQVNFVYLDVDDPQTTSFRRELGYQYQPHFFLLDGEGNVIEQWVGYVDGEVLQQALHEAVQQSQQG